MINSKRWDILIFCLVFTSIGAVGGWMAATSGHPAVGAPEEIDSHATDQAPVDDHAGHDHAPPTADDGPELPPQTLRNLGVTLGTASATTFTKFRAVPAVIERTSQNERPVFAPIGGRVAEILVEPGTVVEAGQTLLTLVRDPIPRPKLSLTEDVLKPAREEIHQAVVELRRTREEISILGTEIDRVSKYTGKIGDNDLPVLPRQTLIDLRYNLVRTKRAHQQSQLELSKHGFTEEQIAGIADGGAIPDLGQDNWRRALTANGLWTDAAQSLFEVLPPHLQAQRWTIATVGELAAGGLIRPELIAWLKSLGDDCAHFLEIGALLQQGYSVEGLTVLHDLNALDAIVQVKAPGEGVVPDWDLASLAVKPGAHVTSGDRLLTLLNPREMYLRSDPVGGENADVLRSIVDESHCEALPLDEASGPHLTELTIEFVTSRVESQGTVAYARVVNQALAENWTDDGHTFRSWRLRAGLRYLLRVPTHQLESVYVLPSAAVTEDGVHKIIFLPDGHSFRAVEVEIAYQDEEVVVLPVAGNPEIEEEATVVTGGAYALGLALRGKSDPVDAHAGHNH